MAAGLLRWVRLEQARQGQTGPSAGPTGLSAPPIGYAASPPPGRPDRGVDGEALRDGPWCPGAAYHRRTDRSVWMHR